MKKIKRCIHCGSKDFIYLFKAKDRMFLLPGEFLVWRCKKCSLVFLNPQPAQAQLKKYYPSQKYYSYKKINSKGLFQILREYLIAHYYSPNIISLFISTVVQNVPAMPSSSKRGRILDIGCGAGDTLLLLQKIGWDVYGVDMDKVAIKNAQSRGLKNVKLGTYNLLSQYPDNFFDAIRMYHVIEHLDDPQECLLHIKKKLKKNGELIVGTPNANSILARIFKSYWYNLDAPRHLFLFSPATLQSVVMKNGFKTYEIEYCSAGGIIGSIQYYLEEKKKKRIDLIHKLQYVLLFYPLDWILNKLNTGDVFVLRSSIK